ncbi:MAG TPA: glycoside hydrolase family 18 protein [Sphingobacteriaceae bacterium]
MICKTICTGILLLLAAVAGYAQTGPTVTAYFAGNAVEVAAVPAEKLTHIIYSFCHLKGNRLNVDNAADSATIRALVQLKNKNPGLKVLLSLGGWGGCASCSDVFSSPSGRAEFAASVQELQEYFKTDGIDLDWEYPAIPGYPGHKFQQQDRGNFTQLLKDLRKRLGPASEISFAAGGFTEFIEDAIEWENVVQYVDRINLMTYDLVNGYSTVTGHHTGLYAGAPDAESTDKTVNNLLRRNVPAEKLVIGAAFYARVWENVSAGNGGLFQAGKFKTSIPFKDFGRRLSEESGYRYFWDSTAQAPYRYNESKKLFATFDDVRSLQLKTQYVIDKKLNGIMFWEITHDKPGGGLLEAIHSTLSK